MHKSAMERKRDAQELEKKALEQHSRERKVLIRDYTAKEVSEKLKVSLPTVYRYIKEGKLEAFKTEGDMWTITSKALDEFLLAQTYRALEGKKKDK